MHCKISVLAILVFLTASVSAAEVEVSTQQDWNQGIFEGTSADRNDNSGNLGLGYKNGTSGDSLVGYWRLDRSVSGSGGTVKDYSGNNNDGTARNGVNTGVTGVFSTNSFDFDGSNDYVALDHYLDCTDCFPDGLTISFWLKRTGTGTGSYDRIGPTFDRSDYFSTAIDAGYINGDNGLIFSVTDSSGNIYDLVSPNSAKLNEWNHWVAVWRPSGEMVIFRNGTEVASKQTGTQLGIGSKRYGFINTGSEASSFDGEKNSQYAQGVVDEVKMYSRDFSSQRIKDSYLRGKSYVGNYTQSIQNSDPTKWDKVEVDTSSIPTDTDVDAVFRAKDSSDNVIDSQVIDLQEGQTNYSLEVADSEKAEIVFNGSSSDATKSWRIDGFKVFAGFCDYRGPENECVMNSTRQLEPQTYDVSSIFESKSTAVFEAFSGTSILNVTNSSRLSGTWKGSYDIRSTPVTIRPGASFTPMNGNIVIGE